MGLTVHGDTALVVGKVRGQESSQEAAPHVIVFPASGWLFLHRHAESSVSMVILDPVRLAISSCQHRFDTLKCAQMVVK